jgi:hypothetical protein
MHAGDYDDDTDAVGWLLRLAVPADAAPLAAWLTAVESGMRAALVRAAVACCEQAAAVRYVRPAIAAATGGVGGHARAQGAVLQLAALE